jgi:hypothetical protein
MIFFTIAHIFNIIVLLNLLLAIICGIMVIKLPIKFYFKYVSIPFIFLITYFLATAGEDILGRPYSAEPGGKYEFLSYRVDYSNKEKSIEVWLLQIGRSRLFSAPYSPDLEQKLAEAANKKKRGARVILDFGQLLPSTTHWNSVEFHFVNVDDFLPRKTD